IGAEAPDDVVAELGAIDGELAFRVQARAGQRDGLAAAVAISNEVALLVAGIVAACHPGARRELRARRAVRQRAAGASADVAVQRTVPPVIALVDVLILRLPAFTRSRLRLGAADTAAAIDGKERHQRGTSHCGAHPADEAAAAR